MKDTLSETLRWMRVTVHAIRVDDAVTTSAHSRTMADMRYSGDTSPTGGVSVRFCRVSVSSAALCTATQGTASQPDP
jgi:hypothetical protein